MCPIYEAWQKQYLLRFEHSFTLSVFPTKKINLGKNGKQQRLA